MERAALGTKKGSVLDEWRPEQCSGSRRSWWRSHLMICCGRTLWMLARTGFVLILFHFQSDSECNAIDKLIHTFSSPFSDLWSIVASHFAPESKNCWTNGVLWMRRFGYGCALVGSSCFPLFKWPLFLLDKVSEMWNVEYLFLYVITHNQSRAIDGDGNEVIDYCCC